MRSLQRRGEVRLEPPHTMYLLGLACLKYFSERSLASAAGPRRRSPRLVVPEEARWEVVRSDPTGNGLVHAIEAIEGQAENADLGHVFTSTGLPELTKNPGRLQHLFTVLENEEVASADGLPGVVDRLIEQYIRQAGWKGEEHYTSRDLAQLLAALLSPSSADTIYDPTCGTGTLLSVCYSQAIQSGADVIPTLYGQELNTETTTLARINTLVHADTQVRIATGDTLLSPAFTKDSTVQKFDRVAAHPPLTLRLEPSMLKAFQDDPFRRFTLGSRQRTRDWAFLQHVVSSLNDEGRAAMVFSAGALITSKDQEVRKHLVESDLVEAVVGLPQGVLNYTGVSVVVLILNKAKPVELQGQIMFVFATEEYDQERLTKRISEQQRKRIVDAVLERHELPRFSTLIPKDEVRRYGYELVPERYIDIVGRDTFMGGQVQWSRLGDLGHVIQGSSLKGSPKPEGHAPVIQGRDVSAPRLVRDDLAKVDVDGSGNLVYSEENDILVQRIGQRPRTYLVGEELAGVLVKNTVYVVRLHERSETLARYLVDFLNSNPGQALLSLIVRGAATPTLGLGDLRELSVPVPDDDVIALCSDLHDVERDLFERVDAARGIRRRLFAIEDPEQAQSQLHSLHAEGRLLAEGLVRVEELDFQVGTFYPFPLAYPYRTSKVILEPSLRYDEQVRMVENIFAYLATVELLIAAHIGALTKADEKTVTRERLYGHWRAGASLGHWLNLGRWSAKAIRRESNHNVAEKFAQLWFKKTRGGDASELAKEMAQLVDLRNDYMHGRGPKTPFELEKSGKRLQGTIEGMLKNLDILAEYPLRLVQDLNSDWETSEVVSNTLLYRGDHPGMPQEALTLPEPLPRDSLHLTLAEGEWVSLYPLINVMYCPRCGARETYFIDRWDGPGNTPILKSFERGHVFEETEITEKIGGHIAHWIGMHFGSPESPEPGKQGPQFREY